MNKIREFYDENLNLEWQESFYFIQAADTQYGMIESFKNGIGDKWEDEVQLIKKLIKISESLNPKPKFLIVCGDLVNSFPGEPYKASQIVDFKNTFKDCSIPLVCVCGNHDVGNVPNEDSIEAYRKDFGADYFAWWVGGVQFLCLNSQYYYDDSKVKLFSKNQSIFLENILGQSIKPKHRVAFQHIPWFLSDPYEDSVYYNYGLESQGTFNLPKDLRLEMLEKFRRHGVSKIFCGHYHRNAGGVYLKPTTQALELHSNEVSSVEVVTTSAVGCQLGEQKSGFRLVKVYSNQIMHKYYEIENFDITDIFLKL